MKFEFEFIVYFDRNDKKFIILDSLKYLDLLKYLNFFKNLCFVENLDFFETLVIFELQILAIFQHFSGFSERLPVIRQTKSSP